MEVLLQPFGGLIWGLWLCLTWRLARRREGRRVWWLPWGLSTVLLMGSLPATAWVMTSWLIGDVETPPLRPASPGVIIVLAGEVLPPQEGETESRPGRSTIVRALAAAEWYHAGEPCLVIVSGGHPEPATPGSSPAATLARLLRQMGVDETRLIVEEQSRNTIENAAAIERLLVEHQPEGGGRWVITSATHLPRAAEVFAAQGVTVSLHGCDDPREELPTGWGALWPRGSVVSLHQTLWREVCGRWVIWWRGTT